MNATVRKEEVESLEQNFSLHYEVVGELPVKVERAFEYLDDPMKLSSHMNASSGMMMGSKMETRLDEGRGQKLGSKIIMEGKVLGITLFLEEIISSREPPFRKEWTIIGEPRLLVIGAYKMGFELKSVGQKTSMRMYIEYNLPKPIFSRILGLFFSGFYARWCTKQMLRAAQKALTPA